MIEREILRDCEPFLCVVSKMRQYPVKVNKDDDIPFPCDLILHHNHNVTPYLGERERATLDLMRKDQKARHLNAEFPHYTV